MYRASTIAIYVLVVVSKSLTSSYPVLYSHIHPRSAIFYLARWTLSYIVNTYRTLDSRRISEVRLHYLSLRVGESGYSFSIQGIDETRRRYARESRNKVVKRRRSGRR